MMWYYVKDGARQGPVEEAELGRLVDQAIVRPDTLVWCEGMADWRPYSTVAPSPPAPPAPPVEAVLEPVPEPAAELAPVQTAAASAVATIASPNLFCTQCGKLYPADEMVRFGAATVCANCKDIYAQRLRETGQTAGALTYGGFWIRFAAILIDGIILLIFELALQRVTGTPRVSSAADIAAAMGSIGLNFLVNVTIGMLYESFFLVQYGATPGKMIFKLKVITPDGGGISWGRAIGRHFAKYLSGITLMIGYIMAGFDSEKRALHDYIAGTRVIRIG